MRRAVGAVGPNPTGPHPQEAGLAAALYTPDWVRAHPVPARLLLLHHRHDFVPRGWPAELTHRAAELNRRTEDALRAFARRALRSTSGAALRRARYAVVDLPYTAVIPHVEAAEPPPRIVDQLITTAYRSIIPASP